MDYICTDPSIGSWSRIPIRARTHTQSDTQSETQLITQSHASAPAGIR